MKSLHPGAIVEKFQDALADDRQTGVSLVLGIMSVAAAVWLGYQFWRLLFFNGWMGAIDLKQRYWELRLWTERTPLYATSPTATYPPASYVLLWPLLGWLPLQPARWLWALTSAGALYWLIRIFQRETGASGDSERRFIALLPLATYGAGATIGNGQLIVHLMPPLLSGLLLLRKTRPGWKTDLGAAGFMLIALVKPSVAAPFFWMILFIPGRIRPAAFLVTGYLILTLFAAEVHQANPLMFVHNWFSQGMKVSSWAARTYDKASVHAAMVALGHAELNPLISIVLWGLLGTWIFRHRRGDIWLLLGVTALITRFWTYHGWYDDVLILLPLTTLYRIAKNKQIGTARIRFVAGILCGLTLLSTLAPGGRYLFPPPGGIIYILSQTCVWVSDLVFLLVVAETGFLAGCRRSATTAPVAKVSGRLP